MKTIVLVVLLFAAGVQSARLTSNVGAVLTAQGPAVIENYAVHRSTNREVQFSPAAKAVNYPKTVPTFQSGYPDARATFRTVGEPSNVVLSNSNYVGSDPLQSDLLPPMQRDPQPASFNKAVFQQGAPSGLSVIPVTSHQPEPKTAKVGTLEVASPTATTQQKLAYLAKLGYPPLIIFNPQEKTTVGGASKPNSSPIITRNDLNPSNKPSKPSSSSTPFQSFANSPSPNVDVTPNRADQWPKPQPRPSVSQVTPSPFKNFPGPTGQQPGLQLPEMERYPKQFPAPSSTNIQPPSSTNWLNNKQFKSTTSEPKLTPNETAMKILNAINTTPTPHTKPANLPTANPNFNSKMASLLEQFKQRMAWNKQGVGAKTTAPTTVQPASVVKESVPQTPLISKPAGATTAPTFKDIGTLLGTASGSSPIRGIGSGPLASTPETGIGFKNPFGNPSLGSGVDFKNPASSGPVVDNRNPSPGPVVDNRNPSSGSGVNIRNPLSGVDLSIPSSGIKTEYMTLTTPTSQSVKSRDPSTQFIGLNKQSTPLKPNTVNVFNNMVTTPVVPLPQPMNPTTPSPSISRNPTAPILSATNMVAINAASPTATGTNILSPNPPTSIMGTANTQNSTLTNPIRTTIINPITTPVTPASIPGGSSVNSTLNGPTTASNKAKSLKDPIQRILDAVAAKKRTPVLQDKINKEVGRFDKYLKTRKSYYLKSITKLSTLLNKVTKRNKATDAALANLPALMSGMITQPSQNVTLETLLRTATTIVTLKERLEEARARNSTAEVRKLIRQAAKVANI